jgi:hypothetical protein
MIDSMGAVKQCIILTLLATPNSYSFAYSNIKTFLIIVILSFSR